MDSFDDHNNSGGFLYPGTGPQFQKGERVFASRGFFQPATVEAVEWDEKSSRYYYYVHFADSDRRLDMWVEADELKRDPKAAARNKNSGAGGAGGTRYPASAPMQLRSATQKKLQGGAYASTVAAATGAGGDRSGSAQGNNNNNNNNTSVTRTESTSHRIASAVANSQAEVAAATPVNTSGKHGQLGAPTRNADSKFFDRPKNVARFYIGEYEVDGWYYSPYLLAHPDVRRNLREAGRNSIWSSIPGDATVSIVDRNKSSSASAASGAAVLGGGLTKAAAAAAAELQRQQQQQLLEKQRAADAQLSAATRDFCLHICPYCLEPELDHRSLLAHFGCCFQRPPGREVYRDVARGVIVFECDGAVHPAFCQNVMLISKAFLEHKTVDMDTVPFVFYPVCAITDAGCEVCGYFSREKRSEHGYNLSCILTLPQYQARGLGRFMIDVSYEISRREGRPGTPEKPLSDFGERMYHSAWRDRVMDAISAHTCMEHQTVTLDQLIRSTGMVRSDVCTALTQLKLLDQKSLPSIAIVLDQEMLKKHIAGRLKRAKQHVGFEPTLLHWFPQWYSRSMALSALTPASASKSNNSSSNQPRGVMIVANEEVLEAAEKAAKREDGTMQLMLGGDSKLNVARPDDKKNKKTRRQRDD